VYTSYDAGTRSSIDSDAVPRRALYVLVRVQTVSVYAIVYWMYMDVYCATYYVLHMTDGRFIDKISE